MKEISHERVCGLDLSLSRTGMAVYSENEPFVESLSLSTKKKGPARLDYYSREIALRVKNRGVEAAFIEGYAMGVRGSRTFDIGELGGCIRRELFHLGVSIAIVPPATLKKFALGSFKDYSKDAMADALRDSYGIEASNDDEVDAILLYLFGTEVCGKRLRKGSTAATLLKKCKVWR